ncbi:hypothetical protein AB0939_15645 [Streptomyces sp. NPDC006990]|uniref:hypothetical protein n=1 Tax=Streptomyces sp. NPDC006990 TaxID=3154481 RepID=UPI003455A33F
MPARDAELRRSAEKLSASVRRIAEQSPAEFDRLVTGLRRVAEHSISEVRTTRSDLGDVMLVVDEGRLGDVVTRGLLPTRREERDCTGFDRLLGIG